MKFKEPSIRQVVVGALAAGGFLWALAITLSVAGVTCSSSPDSQRGFLSSGAHLPGTSTQLPAGVTIGGKAVPTYNAPCLAGERLESDGSAWQCRRLNDYRGKYLEFSNDFIHTADTEWDSTAVSGAGAAVGLISIAGRPGVLDMAMGTTATGRAGRRTSATIGMWDATTTYPAILSVPTLSTSSERFSTWSGIWSTSTSADQTAGCYFLLDEGNVATGGCNTSNLSKLQAFAAQASTRTRVLLNGTSQDGACSAGAITTCDASVTAAGWLNLRTVWVPGVRCEFYVNDSLCTTLTTNVVAAGVSAMNAGVTSLKSVGTTSRSVYLDEHSLQMLASAARSP